MTPTAPHAARMRPKYLNLFAIRLPLPGIVSFLHRVSGVLLFFALPALVWIAQQSLSDAEAYAALRACLAFWPVKFVLLGLLWAFLHHVCAGLRFLLIDLHIGVALPQARASAQLVLIVSLLLTVILGVWLW